MSLFTPVWSCELKGFNFPSGFSIGTSTIRGHELAKLKPTNVGILRNRRFSKLRSISLLYTKATSRIFYNTDNTRFSIGLTLDCVIQMKIVISFYQSEFDPLQLLKKRSCQNMPFSDFGNFLVANLATFSKGQHS